MSTGADQISTFMETIRLLESWTDEIKDAIAAGHTTVKEISQFTRGRLGHQHVIDGLNKLMHLGEVEQAGFSEKGNVYKLKESLEEARTISAEHARYIEIMEHAFNEFRRAGVRDRYRIYQYMEEWIDNEKWNTKPTKS